MYKIFYYVIINKESGEKMNSKLYDYLFLEKEFPYQNKWFKSIIIKADTPKNLNNIVDMFSEIIVSFEYAIKENELIIVIFNEIDFSLEEVILSLSEDLGENILSFYTNKLYVCENRFNDIYQLYNKYISNKHQGYFEISDLILEVVKESVSDVCLLKRIILDKVLSDPQNENLIISMFKNDLNVLKTSKKIYMHRNTINNRLELIKKETGLNIQKFQDAVALFCIMKIK